MLDAREKFQFFHWDHSVQTDAFGAAYSKRCRLSPLVFRESAHVGLSWIWFYLNVICSRTIRVRLPGHASGIEYRRITRRMCSPHTLPPTSPCRRSTDRMHSSAGRLNLLTRSGFAMNHRPKDIATLNSL
jgi:hypothetical protein